MVTVCMSTSRQRQCLNFSRRLNLYILQSTRLLNVKSTYKRILRFQIRIFKHILKIRLESRIRVNFFSQIRFRESSKIQDSVPRFVLLPDKLTHSDSRFDPNLSTLRILRFANLKFRSSLRITFKHRISSYGYKLTFRLDGRFLHCESKDSSFEPQNPIFLLN